MDKAKALSKKDICDIIKAVGKAGVEVFEYNNLRIVRVNKEVQQAARVSGDVVTTMPDDEIDQKEYNAKVDEIGIKHIEDPQGYEEMIISGELE